VGELDGPLDLRVELVQHTVVAVALGVLVERHHAVLLVDAGEDLTLLDLRWGSGGKVSTMGEVRGRPKTLITILRIAFSASLGDASFTLSAIWLRDSVKKVCVWRLMLRR
jgi:hypothetical protein